jgi:hypothetical protein
MKPAGAGCASAGEDDRSIAAIATELTLMARTMGMPGPERIGHVETRMGEGMVTPAT